MLDSITMKTYRIVKPCDTTSEINKWDPNLKYEFQSLWYEIEVQQPYPRIPMIKN